MEEQETREIEAKKQQIVRVKQLGINRYKFLDEDIKRYNWNDKEFDEQQLKAYIKAKKDDKESNNLTYVVGVYKFDCETLTDGVYMKGNRELKGKHSAYY